MLQPGRSYTAGNQYRYGFNGKEKDKDISEGGQDYGMRIYDARLGRFLSVDPLSDEYPELTTYQFASNGPLANTDLDGEEKKWFKLSLDEKSGKPQLTLLKETKEVSILWGLISWKNDWTLMNVEYDGKHYSFNYGGNESGSPNIDKSYNEFIADPEAALAKYGPSGYISSDEDEFKEIAQATVIVAATGAATAFNASSRNNTRSSKTTESENTSTSPSTSTNKQATAANNGNAQAASSNTAATSGTAQKVASGKISPDLVKRYNKLNKTDRSGKNFTKAGKDVSTKVNKQYNGGTTKCDNCGTTTIKPKQDKSGVKTPGNSGETDHNIRKGNRGRGNPDNANHYCKDCNLDKH